MSDNSLFSGHEAGCFCAACSDLSAAQAAIGDTHTVDDDFTDSDQGIDALLSGYKWATTSLSYSFPDSGDDYGYTGFHNATSSFSPVTLRQVEAIEAGLQQFAAVTGLQFTRFDGADDANADLRFGQSDGPPTAFAYFPFSGEEGGDAFFRTGAYINPVRGNYDWATIIHEIGHTLGLKHGHETGDTGTLPDDLDSHEYSIMTYRSYVGASGTVYSNGEWSGPQGPMMLDIAAIQELYGANFDTASGDTVYGFDPLTGEMFVDGVGTGAPGGNIILRTIWDGNGTDTYDVSNYETDVAIDLAPGGYIDLDVGGIAQRASLGHGNYARGHVFNAMLYQDDARSLIENAVGGSGSDLITGNFGDNDLNGGAGADTLLGLDGDDTLTGGAGDDDLTGGAGQDIFVLQLDLLTDGTRDLINDLSFDSGDQLHLSGALTDQFASVDDLASGGAEGLFALEASSAGAAVLSFVHDVWTVAVELVTIEHDVLADAIAALTSDTDDQTDPGQGNDPDTGTGDGEDDADTGDEQNGGDDDANDDNGGDGSDGGADGETDPGDDGDDDDGDTGDGGGEDDGTENTGDGNTGEDGTPGDDDGDPGEDDLGEGDDGDDSPDDDDADQNTPPDDSAADDDGTDNDVPDDEANDDDEDDHDEVDSDDDEEEGETPSVVAPPAPSDPDQPGVPFGEDDAASYTPTDEPDDIRVEEDDVTGVPDGPSVPLDPVPEDVFIFVDVAVFTDGSDRWSGSDLNEVASGRGGADFLSSGAGDDMLWGDSGADTLLGGAGDDQLQGGKGKDKIKGGDNADDIAGNGGADKLRGGDGGDVIEGGGGADKIWGNRGRDDLNGNGGNDRLIGGKGSDTLTGGGGADQFVFGASSGKDTITDFGRGADQLKIAGLESLSDLTFRTKGDDLKILHDHGVIILLGTDRSDITASDFIF